MSGNVCEQLCGQRKTEKITGLNLPYADYFKIHDRPEVEDILEEMIQDISAGLVSIINMLQPEMIVLGYDGIDWPEDYVKKLEVLINDRKITQDGWNIPVKKAYFGKQAQLVGAAALVVNSIFKGELQFLCKFFFVKIYTNKLTDICR